ncbi:MAG: single-stranded-DNA-specific exonuclease RecJ [bacterium]
MKKNWKLKSICSPDHSEENEAINNFIQEMQSLKTNVQLPELVLRFLYLRGITDYQKVLKFFRPSIEKLYDPFLLKDCDKATDRIIEAIDANEKIMILGDYDVDGTCGVSMFYLFLKKLELESEIYIPDRIEEGYGISIKAINLAKEKKINLVVAIDCGITAVDKVEYAKSLGIDFIICDHHQPPEIIPDALAVMDPLRTDCEYPFKYLCGTGVAFKLAQAISNKLGKPDLPNSLIDLVAIATASDIVPLTDENRILVKEGLELINTKPRLSLKVLIESSGLKIGNLTTSNIVFTLAPRINAVGRLGDAKRAVELLTCEDNEKIKEFAFILNDENQNRREIDKSITDDVFKIFDEPINIENQCSIVIHNEAWHPGVIGIVAARLVEKYNLPSIVLTTVNGVGKGSARSINCFNIYEALKQCGDQLIQFGGHFHAAGLEIELSKIEDFRKSFNEIASKEITMEQLMPEIEYDSEVSFEYLTDKFIKIISFFEPFGPENMIPVFITKDVQIIGDVRLAKANTHIFKVRDSESKKIFEAVFFNSLEFSDVIKTGNFCNICYSIDKSFWNGKEYTKLRIRDIKLASYQSE